MNTQLQEILQSAPTTTKHKLFSAILLDDLFCRAEESIDYPQAAAVFDAMEPEDRVDYKDRLEILEDSYQKSFKTFEKEFQALVRRTNKVLLSIKSQPMRKSWSSLVSVKEHCTQMKKTVQEWRVKTQESGLAENGFVLEDYLTKIQESLSAIADAQERIRKTREELIAYLWPLVLTGNPDDKISDQDIPFAVDVNEIPKETQRCLLESICLACDELLWAFPEGEKREIYQRWKIAAQRRWLQTRLAIRVPHITRPVWLNSLAGSLKSMFATPNKKDGQIKSNDQDGD
ncbi:MAG: hypothetical protein EHM41_09835 [Chloroflexi bacterium]|nr:MAG: hypothetical protein EHM41_09835 [Chloroflexota bacterium]